ncbi:MAG: bifunctional diaminohydroxyphosphoribosylaminopyrimidine deaminase/5-amino-6-(5-phosphoribosylamino)uracil reductase RibD [Phycisphaerae bacterium]
MAEEHTRWMRIALDEAIKGRGSVEPNPAVGAVIVRNGQELARGHHKRFGGPHAEREAMHAAQIAGRELRGATMYVTLEPCSHFGKTPPCADALIEAGFARVVVAMEDPDPQVAGGGLDKLRKAGVEVVTGVCENEARHLLAAYVKQRTQSRPWVIGKWAQTADGYLALPPGRGRWISGEVSREDVHRLRAWSEGICVGIGTALTDDPLLNNRLGWGRQPVRVVLDSSLKLPADSQLVRSADEYPLLVVTSRLTREHRREDVAVLRRKGVEVVGISPGPGGLDLHQLLDELGKRRWTYLLVEGGRAVHESFLRAGLYDELRVYVSPIELGPAGGNLPRLDVEEVAARCRLGDPEVHTFGDDRRLTYRPGR